MSTKNNQKLQNPLSSTQLKPKGQSILYPFFFPFLFFKTNGDWGKPQHSKDAEIRNTSKITNEADEAIRMIINTETKLQPNVGI